MLDRGLSQDCVPAQARHWDQQKRTGSRVDTGARAIAPSYQAGAGSMPPAMPVRGPSTTGRSAASSADGLSFVFHRAAWLCPPPKAWRCALPALSPRCVAGKDPSPDVTRPLLDPSFRHCAQPLPRPKCPSALAPARRRHRWSAMSSSIRLAILCGLCALVSASVELGSDWPASPLDQPAAQRRMLAQVRALQPAGPEVMPGFSVAAPCAAQQPPFTSADLSLPPRVVVCRCPRLHRALACTM